MPKCNVTLNIARLGRAYAGSAVDVSDEIPRDDGVYWTTTEPVRVVLANAPLSSVLLDQGAAYRFVLPDGSSSVRVVPTTATADFSDLEVLTRVGGSPPTLVLEPEVYTSTDGLEPFGLPVGGYWIVDNPYLPTHGDLNQKTS